MYLTYNALCAIGLIDIAIGLFVYYKVPRLRNYHYFFLVFSCGIGVWTIAISLLYMTHGMFFERLIFADSAPTFIGLLAFAYAFPRGNTLRYRYGWAALPFAVILASLPFELITRGFHVDARGLVQPINGPLMPFFVLTCGSYALASLILLRKRFKESVGRERIQMSYMTAGVAILMASIIVFDMLFPAIGMYQFNLLGGLGSLVFISLTAYAIIRHQLLDIRIVLQRGIIFSVLLSLIVFAYLAILSVVEFFLQLEMGRASPVSAVIVTAIGIYLYGPLERYLRRKTDALFFKDSYDYSASLQELSDVLNEHNDADLLIQHTAAALERILRVESVQFLHGTTRDQGALSVPVRTKRETLGTLSLGPKRSGDAFTAEDVQLLTTLTAQLAVALEKAKLFGQVRAHSEELEKKVHERTRHLETLRERQRQMIGDITHAFQTPLTVIKGTVAQLTRADASTHTRHLHTIDASVDTVSRLMYELIKLSKLETAPETEHVSFDLSQTVAHVAEYVQTICEENNIILRREVEPGISLVGNKSQIEELVTNLLSNSVRYTRDQKVRVITVSLRHDRNEVLLSVQDTGIGMHADVIPFIFERFYRGREHEHLHGFGLGLTICKRIAQAHDATIDAMSAGHGKGATFTVRFGLRRW